MNHTRVKQPKVPANPKAVKLKALAKHGGRDKLAQRDLVLKYERYFVAPSSTPESFRVLDLTDGATFTLSSHT